MLGADVLPCASRILSSCEVEHLAGAFKPMAEKSLAALPLMSVRTHIRVVRILTGMARTSCSSRMASTTVRCRGLIVSSSSTACAQFGSYVGTTWCKNCEWNVDNCVCGPKDPYGTAPIDPYGTVSSGGFVCESTAQVLPTTGCGNWKLEAGEVCDGLHLGGKTCSSLGFYGGSLSCKGCEIDTEKCYGPPGDPYGSP